MAERAAQGDSSRLWLEEFAPGALRAAVERGPGTPLVIGGRHVGYVGRVWDDEDGLAFDVDWNDR